MEKSISPALKKKLITLADKYETITFCNEDPSQFLRRYKDIASTEAASFLAAMLAFGNRKQFIPKIKLILDMADSSCKSFSCWIKSKAYEKDFPHGKEKFYRFYSYDDLQIFFSEISFILNEEKTLGEFFRKKTEGEKEKVLAEIISGAFPKSAIVPKGKSSANKRIHMFLRWMVRTDSPVDLGLWTWYEKDKLLIPLDVHVMQEAVKMKLLPENSTASRKTALLLTEKMKEVFPHDPARSDFALFGLGVTGDYV